MTREFEEQAKATAVLMEEKAKATAVLVEEQAKATAVLVEEQMNVVRLVEQINAKAVLHEEQIKSMRLQLLRVQGVLNARGIFEFIIVQAGYELKPTKSSKRLDVTTTCKMIGEMIHTKQPPENSLHFTKAIYDIAVECGCKGTKDLSSLYKSLSHEIHGYPWYESSVYIFADELGKRDACILKKMCEFLHVEGELIQKASLKESK